MHDASHGSDGRRAAEGRRGALQNGVGDFAKGIAGKGRLAGEHLEENGAHGEEVGTGVDGLAAKLFGGGVARRANKHADASFIGKGRERFLRRRGRQMFGDSEIEQLGATAGKNDVFGLQVAMHDADFVEGFESGQNRQDDLRGFLRGQRAMLDALRERFALDELHDQNQALLFLGDVVDAAGVGMGHLGGGARLLPKAFLLRHVGV